MITNTVHEYQCHGQSKRHLLVSIRIMKLFTVVSIIIKSGFGKLFMSPASAQEKRFLSTSSYSYQSQQKQYKPRISNKVTPKWSHLRLKKTKIELFILCDITLQYTWYCPLLIWPNFWNQMVVFSDCLVSMISLIGASKAFRNLEWLEALQIFW